MDWGRYGVPQGAWGTFSAFFDFWQSQQSESDLVPLKAELCPARLGRLANEFALIERESPGRFVYRLVAAGLHNRVRRDRTGEQIASIFSPSIAERVRRGFERASETISGLYHSVDIELECGDIVNVDCIYLPLKGEPEDRYARYFAAHMHMYSPEDRLAEDSSRPRSYMMGDVVYFDVGHGVPSPSFEFLPQEYHPVKFDGLKRIV